MYFSIPFSSNKGIKCNTENISFSKFLCNKNIKIWSVHFLHSSYWTVVTSEIIFLSTNYNTWLYACLWISILYLMYYICITREYQILIIVTVQLLGIACTVFFRLILKFDSTAMKCLYLSLGVWRGRTGILFPKHFTCNGPVSPQLAQNCYPTSTPSHQPNNTQHHIVPITGMELRFGKLHIIGDNMYMCLCRYLYWYSKKYYRTLHSILLDFVLFLFLLLILY